MVSSDDDGDKRSSLKRRKSVSFSSPLSQSIPAFLASPSASPSYSTSLSSLSCLRDSQSPLPDPTASASALSSFCGKRSAPINEPMGDRSHRVAFVRSPSPFPVAAVASSLTAERPRKTPETSNQAQHQSPVSPTPEPTQSSFNSSLESTGANNIVHESHSPITSASSTLASHEKPSSSSSSHKQSQPSILNFFRLQKNGNKKMDKAQEQNEE